MSMWCALLTFGEISANNSTIKGYKDVKINACWKWVLCIDNCFNEKYAAVLHFDFTQFILHAVCCLVMWVNWIQKGFEKLMDWWIPASLFDVYACNFKLRRCNYCTCSMIAVIEIMLWMLTTMLATGESIQRENWTGCCSTVTSCTDQPTYRRDVLPTSC